MTSEWKLKMNRKTILVLMVLIAVSLIIALKGCLFDNQIFGYLASGRDIGSDTGDLYLSQYISIVRKLRSGHFSLWDATNGFGVNMMMLSLTNPFLDLVYLGGVIAGPEAVPYLVLPVYMLEILLAGLFAYFFLSAFDFDETAKLMTSYMYAFSGYMIIWGQHYQFGASAVFLPLELLFAERCLCCGRKWKALTLMSFLLALSSMYMGYMALLATAVYVILRIVMKEGISAYQRFLLLVRAAFAAALGAAMAMVTIIPSVIAIFGVSERMESEFPVWMRLFPHLFPFYYYLTLFCRMFSTTMLNIGQFMGYANYYEGPCLYFSILFIPVLFQYLFLIPRMAGSRRKIICHYVIFVLAVLSVMITPVSVVMNGFAYAVSRWFFAVFVYFAIVTALTLTWMIREKTMSRAGLILGIAGLAGGNALCVLYMHYRKYHVSMFPAVLGIAMIVCVWVSVRKNAGERVRRLLITAVVLLLAVNLTKDARNNFVNRANITKNGTYFTTLFDSDTTRAIRYLQKTDPSLYRIEKTYGTTLGMDAAVQDYYSISSYNSTHNRNILDYVRTYWPSLFYADGNHLLFSRAEDLGAGENQPEFLGVRYILTMDRTTEISGYAYYKTFGGVTVLKNDDACLSTLYPAGENTTVGTDAEDGVPTITVDWDSRLTDGTVIAEATEDEDEITETVTTNEDAYLLTTIPYENGWTVTVDGEKVETVKANSGFQAVLLTAGNHTVTCRFNCPGLRAGAVVSLAALLVFLAAGAVTAERRKKRA